MSCAATSVATNAAGAKKSSHACAGLRRYHVHTAPATIRSSACKPQHERQRARSVSVPSGCSLAGTDGARAAAAGASGVADVVGIDATRRRRA